MPAQPWINRSCPACHANLGEPCTGDGYDADTPHPQRLVSGQPIVRYITRPPFPAPPEEG